jgi:tetratricopeptide (TPR) repeat protein
MPLINSLVKARVRQRFKDHLLIEDRETSDSYEYSSADRNLYVEGEILHIRVEGLDRNLEVGRFDLLAGPVVESELDPVQFLEKPLEWKDRGVWNPVYLYGEKAAEDLFPSHNNQSSFRICEVLHPVISDPEDWKSLDEARKKMLENDFEGSRLLLSGLLNKSLGHLECLRLLAFMHLQRAELEVAEKYLKSGLSIVESKLPGDPAEYILPGNLMGNFIYLSFLQGSAFAWEHRKDKEKALEYYRKCYMCDPMDHLAARFAIHRLTGEPMPLLEQTETPGIDPYTMIDKYEIPIHDSYDPNVKVNPEEWLNWPESYRYILILQAHRMDPIFQSKNPDTIQTHMALHHVAENALALNDPPKVRLDAARLIGSGMTRQDVIHFLGQQLLAQTRQPADSESTNTKQ